MKLPWVTGFSVCGSEEKLFVYSGNLIKGYNESSQNLGDCFPPKVPRNVLPEKSKELFEINLNAKSVSSIPIPPEAAGSCTSTITLNKEGVPLLIVSDPNLWLYSPSLKYEPELCDLEKEYGGCKIDLQQDSNIYKCMVPRCSIQVHTKCDTTIKGNPNIATLMCPKCRDIDPETLRKRPKIPTGRSRGRSRKK